MAGRLRRGQCTIADCANPHEAHGWCNKHYQRWRAHGDPLGIAEPRQRMAILDRFWSHVDRSGGPDGCWLWTGRTTTRHYGQFWDGTRSLDGRPHIVAAHRWSYEHFVGPIPEGHGVLHRCDTPPCVYPGDLFTGSHAENMADMARKGRASRLPGEANSSAKLTAEQVQTIRAHYRPGGPSQRVLAARYGITQAAVSGPS